MEAHAIELAGVATSFDVGRTRLLDGLDVCVRRGELLALIGASGSGKTTILRLIQRLVEPLRGTVRVGGRDVRELDPIALRQSIGYVIQDVGLFPHLSVLENVAPRLRLAGQPFGRRSERAREIMRSVGLDPRAVARAAVVEALSPFVGAIDTATMRRANRNLDHVRVHDAASGLERGSLSGAPHGAPARIGKT